MLKHSLTALILSLCSIMNAHANPGQDAKDCLTVTNGNEKAVFHNSCDERIFVLWCGQLKYSDKGCGDGPDGGFYTHSINIDAGQDHEIDVKGEYTYASCRGGIDFGNSKYKDFPDGSYQCLE